VRRYGAFTGDEIPLMGERLVVGRFDPETGPVDVDLSSVPDSEHISRHHAELYREGGQWFVRDLGSTNGVFVRTGDAAFGPRITAPRQLSDGDEVAFGNARLVFRGA
jgi:pSer/pThr/pTyr-binding forkhead associated (FHA) protein